jgi:hypothetical protein
MKKYIRAVLDDLRSGRKDYIPPVPKPLKHAKTIDLDVPPAPAVAEDLDNLEPSKDPAERRVSLTGRRNRRCKTLGTNAVI